MIRFLRRSAQQPLPEGNKFDFLVKEEKEIRSLLQISYNIADFNTKGREIKPLLKLSDGFKCRNLLVITWDYEAEERLKNKKIKFIPHSIFHKGEREPALQHSFFWRQSLRQVGLKYGAPASSRTFFIFLRIN